MSKEGAVQNLKYGLAFELELAKPLHSALMGGTTLKDKMGPVFISIKYLGDWRFLQVTELFLGVK